MESPGGHVPSCVHTPPVWWWHSVSPHCRGSVRPGHLPCVTRGSEALFQAVLAGRLPSLFKSDAVQAAVRSISGGQGKWGQAWAAATSAAVSSLGRHWGGLRSGRLRCHPLPAWICAPPPLWLFL